MPVPSDIRAQREKAIKPRTIEERIDRMEGMLDQITRNYSSMAERFNMMAEGYAKLLEDKENPDGM